MQRSPTQILYGITLLLSGLAIFARPEAIIGSVAFISLKTGISPQVYALSFLVCGAYLCARPFQPPARFLLLHLPFLFYLIMASWYFVITANLSLIPMALYTGYALQITLYVWRNLHHDSD